MKGRTPDNPGLATAKTEWRALKTLRGDLLAEAHAHIAKVTAERRAGFAKLVNGLLAEGLKKSQIAEYVGIARTTLDAILAEAATAPSGASGVVDLSTVRGEVEPYWFERGFRTNVHLRGTLPDTGGFPELAGEVDIRWVRLPSGYVPADYSGDVADYLVVEYGEKVAEFAGQ